MQAQPGMGRLYTVAFVASTCTLVLEIVAGRILAPHVGVSLYTWTSVIGVVLAGISVGNYLGGRLADRFPGPSTLGLMLLMASLTSFGILGLATYLPGETLDLPLVPRILALTAAIFFLPSCVLGMVTPVVVKQALTDINRTGKVVGKIYAVSTAGSILGVYLTGFVLIAIFGTRLIVVIVAAILLVLAFLFGNLRRARVAAAVLLIPTIASAGYSTYLMFREGHCTIETNYFCIKVYDEERDGQRVRKLVLDQLVHSYSSLENPHLMVYGYTQTYVEAAAYLAEADPSLRTLFIGGGGYTVPRHLEVRYPQASVEVMEIDPGVTEVAHRYFGLDANTRVVTYNEDARMALSGLKYQKYHLIVGDAFNDLSVPYHLTTLEFSRAIRDLLADNGMYMTNIVDRLQDGRFLRAYVRTLQQLFPSVYVLSNADYWDSPYRGTYVVAASLRPIPFDRFVPYRALAGIEPGSRRSATVVMPPPAMAEWLQGGQKELLTDDHAPVDTMLAALFLARAPEWQVNWRWRLPAFITRLWQRDRGASSGPAPMAALAWSRPR